MSKRHRYKETDKEVIAHLEGKIKYMNDVHIDRYREVCEMKEELLSAYRFIALQAMKDA